MIEYFCDDFFKKFFGVSSPSDIREAGSKALYEMAEHFNLLDDMADYWREADGLFHIFGKGGDDSSLLNMGVILGSYIYFAQDC